MEKNFDMPAKSEKTSDASLGESKDKKKKLRVPLGEAPAATHTQQERQRKAPGSLPLRELLGRQHTERQKTKDGDGKTQRPESRPDARSGDTPQTSPAEAGAGARPQEGNPRAEAAKQPGESSEPLVLPELNDAERKELAKAARENVIMDRSSEKLTEPREEVIDFKEPAPGVPPPLPFAIPFKPGEQIAETGQPRPEAVDMSTPEPAEVQPAATVETPVEPAEAPVPILETGGGQPPVVPPYEQLAGTPEDPEPPMAMHPEFMPVMPATFEQEGTVMDTMAMVNPSERTTTVAEAKKAEEELIAEHEYYAEKQGLRHGLAAGGMFGYLLGRRRGRIKAEREAAKEAKQYQTEIKTLEGAQQESVKKENSFKAAIENLGKKIRSFERTVTKSEEKQPRAATEKQPGTKPEKLSHEKLSREKLTPEQLAAVKKELPPEEKPITEETYRAPEGHRFETSAWHRYEVDAATGRLAENPSQTYGEEFQKELKQERVSAKPFEPAAAMQIGHAVMYANPVGAPPVAPYGVPQPGDTHLPSQVMPGEPAAKKQKTDMRPKAMAGQVLTYAKQPVIWIAAFVIVVLLFAIGWLH